MLHLIVYRPLGPGNNKIFKQDSFSVFLILLGKEKVSLFLGWLFSRCFLCWRFLCFGFGGAFCLLRSWCLLCCGFFRCRCFGCHFFDWRFLLRASFLHWFLRSWFFCWQLPLAPRLLLEAWTSSFLLTILRRATLTWLAAFSSTL